MQYAKKTDIILGQNTLWESVEKWVTKYLKKNHSEYRELQMKAMRIVLEKMEYRIYLFLHLERLIRSGFSSRTDAFLPDWLKSTGEKGGFSEECEKLHVYLFKVGK